MTLLLLIVGSIGTLQAANVVIDTTFPNNYLVEPGHQERVTAH